MGRKGLNPADAHRRAQKKKQIAKNKKQRELTREARRDLDRPEELKKKLQGILDSEDHDFESKGVSMKRQVYQKAYEAAIVKQKDRELRIRREEREREKAGGSRSVQGQPRTGSAPLPPPSYPRPSSSYGGGRPNPASKAPALLPRQWAPRPRQTAPSTSNAPAPAATPPAAASPPTVTLSAAPALSIKRAEKNEKLVSMVPASLRAKQKIKKHPGGGGNGGGSGFGLAPVRSGMAPRRPDPPPAKAQEQALDEAKAADQNYQNFMDELGGLGAFQ